MNNQTTINDHICHLFKYGVYPGSVSICLLTDPHAMVNYLNVPEPVRYQDSIQLSKSIFDIAMHTVLKDVIEYYLKRFNRHPLTINVSSFDILNNIVWDKFPYKIDYIRPIKTPFKPEGSSILINTFNFQTNYQYSIQLDFINYYNNIMSGRKKCPKALLENKDISYLLHLRSNINKVKANTISFKIHKQRGYPKLQSFNVVYPEFAKLLNDNFLDLT